MKVKVIKAFSDLEVGDELVYSPKYETYEYASTDEEVSATSSRAYSKYISLSKEVVEGNIGSFFERIEAIDWSKAVYVKPIIIKAVVDNDNMIVKGWDNSTVTITKDQFNKLFKIIE